ncbi:hypothetical protein ANAEL_03980 [Anaerolineales bacterium]|nr:hypothetical protein ANAEL_03980 [Anaerolineales bacterium]
MLFRKLRENSQVLAMLAAVCLGLAAQYYFTGEIFTHQKNSNTWEWTSRFSLALVLLFIATGFAAWSSFPQDRSMDEPTTPLQFFADGSGRRRVWLIASGASYLLSILLYVLVGENGWVRFFWVTGIGLLIVPLWLQLKGDPREKRIATWEWALVGFISLIGFGLRYWNLTEVPSHVDNDVALMGTYGVGLIRAENYNWIGYSTSQHLLSYDQFQAWGMRLFGQNHYGIVMHSVVLGTLSLVLIFLLGRELGGGFVGFIAIGLLAISYTHIQFSRILFGNSASFAVIMVMYAFFKGLRTHAPFWFALSGVFAGWGVLLYDSSRVVPLVLFSMMIWHLWSNRKSIKNLYKNWMVLTAGALFGLGPMLVYAVLHFSDFAGRANVVTLWEPGIWRHAMDSYQTNSPLVILLEQTWRAFLTLYLTGDRSPHFAFPRPMVSPITALFFTLGLGYAIFRLKNIRYFSILVWIFLTFVFGGVLTADPPYWPHLNIALPAIVLLAAVGAESLADKVTVAFGWVGYKVYVWVLAGILLVTGLNNWQIYYDFVKNNAGNRIRIARYLQSLPSNYYVYLVSDDFSWNEHAFRFFSQGTQGMDFEAEKMTNVPPVIEDRPTVFILFRHPELVPFLQSHYPEGILENHYDFDNRVSFISYRIVPSTADATPEPLEVSALSSPGWQLIFLFAVFWIGYVAYNHYSMRETVAGSE